MTTPETALAALAALADPARAAEIAALHRAPRRYLGAPPPQVEALVAGWRGALDVPGRVALAAALWDSDIHEARIAAAKLLTQARLRPDADAWALIATWAADLDGRALADAAARAGARRLEADPARLDRVETWLDHPNPWTRHAALAMTRPWTKQNHPKPGDLAIRDRVLGWCARLAGDPDPILQTAIAGWLRELSKHDPDRVRGWLATAGGGLRPLARREAETHL